METWIGIVAFMIVIWSILSKWSGLSVKWSDKMVNTIVVVIAVLSHLVVCFYLARWIFHIIR